MGDQSDRDPRDVICGIEGDIHWRPVLPSSGLDGLETKGVWERDGDSLLVPSKDGTASLAFGEESWEDCELDVQVTPLEGGNAQVVVRSSYMGAYVVDLMLGYRLPKRQGIVSLSVQNIFDEDFEYLDDSYRTFQDEPTAGPYLPELGIMGRLTLNF